MKKEIENRADVFFLVDTFYTKIRADDLLGPIFNGVIDDWPSHLERLTDFWETNLFFVNKFKGCASVIIKAADHSRVETVSDSQCI